jgi:uncharacterized protein (TIGR00255 family)
MIRSMTGYGESRADLPEGRLTVTVKTVNHRFFNAHLRTPPGFDRWEGDLQQWLKAFFARGHVNLSVGLDRGRGIESNGFRNGFPQLNLHRARHYRDLLETLRIELDLPGEPDLSTYLMFGDLFERSEISDTAPGVDGAVLRELVEAAARDALAMRKNEGLLLEEDLRERLRTMESLLEAIEKKAPLRLVAERDRLQAAVRELAQQESMDEDRLAKEIAYLAERWDINEEIVRFRAHLHAFRETLDRGDGEPVGKRLGFLVQEMHREVNTIASKANDLEIAHASVTIREDIERLREQLENVE